MTPAPSRTIRITAGAVSAKARLDASKTASAIWDALPIEAKAETWGDEIYFGIGATIVPESQYISSPHVSAFASIGSRDVGRRNIFRHRGHDRAGVAAGDG